MKFIFPLAFLTISVLLLFFVVNPTYADIKQLSTDVNAYNVALSHSTDLQKTRDSLVDKYKNIKQEDRDRLERFLPNTANNIKFILEIERVANLHSMPINNIKFEAPKSQDTTDPKTGATIVAASDPTATRPYGSFPIEFTTEGNYDTFVSFLKDIEHNLRLVDIKSVSFSVPPPATKGTIGDPNIYTYTLKVETYWLK